VLFFCAAGVTNNKIITLRGEFPLMLLPVGNIHSPYQSQSEGPRQGGFSLQSVRAAIYPNTAIS